MDPQNYGIDRWRSPRRAMRPKGVGSCRKSVGVPHVRAEATSFRRRCGRYVRLTAPGLTDTGHALLVQLTSEVTGRRTISKTPESPKAFPIV